MKKVYLLSLLAAFMAGGISCSKEEEQPVEEQPAEGQSPLTRGQSPLTRGFEPTIGSHQYFKLSVESVDGYSLNLDCSELPRYTVDLSAHSEIVMACWNSLFKVTKTTFFVEDITGGKIYELPTDDKFDPTGGTSHSGAFRIPGLFKFSCNVEYSCKDNYGEWQSYSDTYEDFWMETYEVKIEPHPYGQIIALIREAKDAIVDADSMGYTWLYLDTSTGDYNTLSYDIKYQYNQHITDTNPEPASYESEKYLFETGRQFCIGYFSSGSEPNCYYKTSGSGFVNEDDNDKAEDLGIIGIYWDIPNNSFEWYGKNEWRNILGNELY
jgi:hypothetical protein